MENILKKLVEELTQNLGNKNINLPTNIDFKTAEDKVYIHINNPDLNMQDDNACFEGWIISLKHHLNKQKFVLNWENGNKVEKNGHYNRFLFRVHKFKNMFENCFEIDESKVNEVKDFIGKLKSGKYLLNEPRAEKQYKEDENKINENYIEGLFSEQYSSVLKEKANLQVIYSQLPVGVFENKVKQDNGIFTGKKSALDLWGINDETKTISIFELKYNNIMMGIVSELLFYMYMLEELCISNDGLFKYLDTKKSFRGAENFKDNKRYDFLKGYFLADRLHPLITEEYIYELNKGLKNLGNLKGNLKIESILYKYDDGKIEIIN